jgi:hemerythrin-like domain-containing protein
MPVKIGGPAEHNFDQPLGLLSDCHRRIERFLAVLVRIAEDAGGRALHEDEIGPLTTALRYFREAAPRHTADEEESLFPRMRACASTEIGAALERVAALESDHTSASRLHSDVDELFTEWQNGGMITPEKEDRLRRNLEELAALYSEHIRLEDEFVFPLAGRTLDRDTQRAIGREMAQRRGIHMR